MTGAVTPAASSGAERMRAFRARRSAAARAELEDAARQAMLPISPVAELDPIEGGKGGRPAGSVQRTTAQLRALYLSRFRNPVMIMGEISARPAGDLAAELDCTKLEAMQLQIAMLKEASRYINSPMPMGVQLNTAPLAPVTINLTAPQSPGAVRGPGIIGRPLVVEHQRLSEEGKQ